MRLNVFIKISGYKILVQTQLYFYVVTSRKFKKEPLQKCIIRSKDFRASALKPSKHGLEIFKKTQAIYSLSLRLQNGYQSAREKKLLRKAVVESLTVLYIQRAVCKYFLKVSLCESPGKRSFKT